MKKVRIIALKNKFLVEGMAYDVSESTATALVTKGAAYLEGDEPPKKRKTRKKKVDL